jgi:hypothetical protein
MCLVILCIPHPIALRCERCHEAVTASAACSTPQNSRISKIMLRKGPSCATEVPMGTSEPRDTGRSTCRFVRARVRAGPEGAAFGGPQEEGGLKGLGPPRRGGYRRRFGLLQTLPWWRCWQRPGVRRRM